MNTIKTFLPSVAMVACCSADPLPIYQPKVKLVDIYFHHPGAKPALLYNHDVDIVKLR